MIPTALTQQWQKPKDLISQRGLRKLYSKFYSHPGFAVYTLSYSFNPHVCLHVHSAERTIGLLNQKDRNRYPYNSKYVGDTGNWTRDNWLNKCILSYHSTIRAIQPRIKYFNFRAFKNSLGILYKDSWSRWAFVRMITLDRVLYKYPRYHSFLQFKLSWLLDEFRHHNQYVNKRWTKW